MAARQEGCAVSANVPEKKGLVQIAVLSKGDTRRGSTSGRSIGRSLWLEILLPCKIVITEVTWTACLKGADEEELLDVGYSD